MDLYHPLPRILETTSRWLAETAVEAHNSYNDTSGLYNDHEGDTGLLTGHGGDIAEGDGQHSAFGVHITYEDLYASLLFFIATLVAGQIAARLLSMPALVGEIICGVILGPGLLNYVPNPLSFVMLGEIGLILLVIEAGIDIDLTTLKLIGARGVSIAIVGSILPIGFGIAIAFALGTDAKGAIAGGAAFGPTSLGIAMNILRSAKIINTPVGQMIVAAAVIDDMIALIVLSQLNALVGEVTAAGIIVPIVSALGFLLIGGYLAIFQLPALLERFIFIKLSEEQKGPASLAILFLMLLGLMPATYYAQASFLMGAFIAGLTFCSNHEAHHWFVSQLKRVMTWLLRIFFAASIGFQVPIKEFASGTVIWQGLVFLLALLGKLAVGFMVPNFTQYRRFTKDHLRDCLIVGFSMAAEGEFAFVIAVFAVDASLISVELYASIVLAVLLSTILAPFSLRMTISYYNKKTKKVIEDAENLEQGRDMELERLDEEKELVKGILQKTTVFLCIQTHSDSGWGLLPRIMSTMGSLKLEIIDHRSWNPRGVNTTLVNEIYAKDTLEAQSGEADQALEKRLQEIQERLLKCIGQPNARVKVHRWFPGIVEEIVEETTVCEDGTITTKFHKNVASVQDQILSEAQNKLEASKAKQLAATKQKTVEEIMKEQGNEGELPVLEEGEGNANAGSFDHTTSVFPGSPSSGDSHEAALTTTNVAAVTEQSPPRPRRVRMKTKSTPVVGGDLFASPTAAVAPVAPAHSAEYVVPPAEAAVAPSPTPATIPEDSSLHAAKSEGAALSGGGLHPQRRPRRIKTRSTPATGGDLFGMTGAAGAGVATGAAAAGPGVLGRPPSVRSTFQLATPAASARASGLGGGLNVAEILIDGKLYRVILNDDIKESVLKDARLVREGVSTLKKKSSGAPKQPSFDTQLTGFVRKHPTAKTVATVPEEEEMRSDDFNVDSECEKGLPSFR